MGQGGRSLPVTGTQLPLHPRLAPRHLTPPQLTSTRLAAPHHAAPRPATPHGITSHHTTPGFGSDRPESPLLAEVPVAQRAPPGPSLLSEPHESQKNEDATGHLLEVRGEDARLHSAPDRDARAHKHELGDSRGERHEGTRKPRHPSPESHTEGIHGEGQPEKKCLTCCENAGRVEVCACRLVEEPRHYRKGSHESPERAGSRRHPARAAASCLLQTSSPRLALGAAPDPSFKGRHVFRCTMGPPFRLAAGFMGATTQAHRVSDAVARALGPPVWNSVWNSANPAGFPGMTRVSPP